MKKYIFIILLSFVPSVMMAQAAGGQITRKKANTTTKTTTRKNNSSGQTSNNSERNKVPIAKGVGSSSRSKRPLSHSEVIPSNEVKRTKFTAPVINKTSDKTPNDKTEDNRFFFPIQETTSENKIHDTVETMPSFPGGQIALMDYLRYSVNYPKDAQKNGIQGRVIVSFVIDVDGAITEVIVENPVYPSLDREAYRVVKSMPRWIPGRQEGKPVRVKYHIPISFRLE